MKIRLAQNADRKLWNDFVNEHPNSTIFYLWEFRELLENYFGFKPFYFFLENNLGVEGVFPIYPRGSFGSKRISSIPFADYGGPLLKNDKFLDIFWKNIKNKFDPIGKLEIHSKNAWIKTNNDLNADHNSFCYFLLDSNKSFKDLLTDNIHQKTRNMINKSNKSDVRVFEDEEFKNLKNYYDLYYQTMLKIRTLPLPFSFFQDLLKKFKKNMHLFLATYENKIAAGILAFSFKNTLYIWSNASNREYLKFAVNNAVYAHAIKHACDDSSLNKVNFGSTLSSGPHYNFKKKWGGEEFPIYFISNRPITNDQHTQNLAMIILSKLPRPIMQPLSKKIIQYY